MVDLVTTLFEKINMINLQRIHKKVHKVENNKTK